MEMKRKLIISVIFIIVLLASILLFIYRHDIRYYFVLKSREKPIISFVPFERDVFNHLDLPDSCFNIEIKNYDMLESKFSADAAIYSRPGEKGSILVNYLFRFITAQNSHQTIKLIEFPIEMVLPAQIKVERYQCILIVHQNIHKASFILWYSPDISSFNELTKNSFNWSVGGPSVVLKTNLSLPFIKKVFPDFRGEYHYEKLKSISFECDTTKRYNNWIEWASMELPNNPQFYKRFSLEFSNGKKLYTNTGFFNQG